MNMSISNIYHYFGNKEGLLLAVMEFASTGLMDKLYKVVQTDMPPLERFKKLVRTHIESSDYYKKEVKIFFWMKNIFRKREMKSITGFNKRFANIPQRTRHIKGIRPSEFRKHHHRSL